jgi:hypothetical protein
VSHFEAPDTPANASRPLHLRSRVTNGKVVFAIGGDGRGGWTRRWKDLCEAHTNDCGGAPRLTEAKLSLCRRAATLEVQLEQLEAQMSEGKDVDLASYAMVAGHLRRILESVGLGRAMKPTQTLDEYLASRPLPVAIDAESDA